MTENKMGTRTEIGTGTEDWDRRVRMQMRERVLMQVQMQMRRWEVGTGLVSTFYLRHLLK